MAVDGRVVATVDADLMSRLGIRSGEEVATAVVQELQRASRMLATYDRAVNMLAARSRASRELRDALLRKGEPPAHVDAAITRLTELGHLDDERFARQFTRSRVLTGGVARRRIRGELARRGIFGSTADEAIDEVLADEAVDENALLLSAARKRVRAMERLDPRTRRRRLHAWLARRGFDSDDIVRALDALLRERADEVSE